MEKRIFLAVVISIAILALWGAVIPKVFPQLAKQQQQTSTQSPVRSAQTTTSATTTTSKGASASAGLSSIESPSTPAKAGAPSAPIAASAEKQTVVEGHDFVARFSNRGGELVSYRLKRYTGKSKEPLELVKGRDFERADFPFAIETRDVNLTRRLDTALYALTQRNEKNANVLEYRYSA